jgi:NADPH-dependent 2,4-dienoyl-CoA reductase/sulfur reductase-like enzyme/nitrite reductase/ring-hydroxylating ferredoxin subunit
MAGKENTDKGPDLALGVPITELPASGLLRGHVGGDSVLLARSGEEFFAIGASCPHYHAPLADGLIVDDTVRCPWHHACFSLRTGEAVRAPALDPLACWMVEQRDGKIFVTGKKQARSVLRTDRMTSPALQPSRILIVGGGAAGLAAAEMLRRLGYPGSLAIISEDAAAPVDRPNLSKDYLAGTAPEKWMPLKPKRWYAERGIELRTSIKVAEIDVAAGEVTLGSGERIAYDRLLLATGAEPIRLAIPGAHQPNVYTLRSLGDCRNIIAAAQSARCAVVIGAGFIGLEVAAALRTRGLQVHVVAPQRRPLERVFGAELGEFVRGLHQEHGVVFHLDDSPIAIEGRRVRLKCGASLDADFVVTGVGVQPRIELAEKAGLEIDRGVRVDPFLETSVPGVFAAGDIARWPDRRTGEWMRIEHWVVAQRQGQVAARNILGARERYADVPYFWSQHYDVRINYVGHAEDWDEVTIDGDIAGKDCLIRYNRKGRTLAVATIGRDLESLRAALAIERYPAHGPS